MLTSLLAFVALQVPTGPMVPAGASAEFNKKVIAVEERLFAGEFEPASLAAALLPRSAVTVHWEDSAVPAGRKQEFLDARGQAFQQFNEILKTITFTVSPTDPDLIIAFVPKLVAPDGSPLGATLSVADVPGVPRLKATIALERGAPLQPVEFADVRNELQYALGTYFGLGPSKLPGAIMYRSESPWRAVQRIVPFDLKIVQSNLKIADDLRTAAANKTRIEPARPKLSLDAVTLDLGTTTQGETIPFSVKATNTGNAPLVARIYPDCGCLMATQGLSLKPGQSMNIEGRIDSTEFVGDLKKTLILVTNDHVSPNHEFPIVLKVKPRYRLLSSSGPVVVMPVGGTSIDVFLFTSDGKPLAVKEARLDGLPGSVSFSNWAGSLADPELGEGPKERKGTKFTVRLDDALPPGRASATLVIGTDDPKFEILYHNISAQKGIVALPDQVWLGEIGRTTKRATFLLSRPETGFAITNVTSNNRSLKATHQAVRGSWEHKVVVEYDGQADFGSLEAMLTVHTDDPKQPKILVPVRAVVR